MAKLADILQQERERDTAEQWDIIHLYKTGSFYSAYEWSAWLIQQVPREREFLADELGLQLHMGKLHIQEIHSGIEFLGAFIKPYRDYVSNKTLERMTKKIQEIDLRNEEKARRTMDSYLGILSHTASRHIAIDLGLASKPRSVNGRSVNHHNITTI